MECAAKPPVPLAATLLTDDLDVYHGTRLPEGTKSLARADVSIAGRHADR